MDNEKRKAMIREVRRRIRELRTALQELLVSGVSSASLSQGGASQAFTRISAGDLRLEIARLSRELEALKRGGALRVLSPDFEICGGR